MQPLALHVLQLLTAKRLCKKSQAKRQEVARSVACFVEQNKNVILIILKLQTSFGYVTRAFATALHYVILM